MSIINEPMSNLGKQTSGGEIGTKETRSNTGTRRTRPKQNRHFCNWPKCSSGHEDCKCVVTFDYPMQHAYNIVFYTYILTMYYAL